ncbi:WecB/TagA/CpsF family glycosyltransferase [Glycomyces harbinensis]|uniref:N-acetylglucosaminyldiphosphoundecaprenol N-acetyl-beta-D-mannosaminyltransferase n=1 Tax=Glycomyces harbinensis TaxID=58114 RepID=A0A1G6TXH3_9ACTN|nr:WecB/TagA/CpsF family glycosyltransferase [Glycomyces harbinensis]SDD33741.1 N-acetylglucosaminyldiphosphoundecaprenol N-acetyl-beta-D-mannosaminyltransferase [Glycomyces harbinensis]
MERLGPSRTNRADGSPAARIRLGGIGIDPLTQEGAVRRVLEALESGRGGQIVTPNVDILAAARRSRELRTIVEASDLVVADGAPLVWASRIARTPLPERVAGSDLVWSLSAAAAERGLRIALLGGTPDGATRPTERAAEILEARYPGLKIAGAWCPPMGFDRDAYQWRALVERVEAAAPDLVYVGLGFPKQEHVTVRLRAAAPKAWFLGCGASIDFIAGYRRRAPKWMQRTGTEWLFRMLSEPRRLARRYLRDDVPEALRLLAEAYRRRR